LSWLVALWRVVSKPRKNRPFLAAMDQKDVVPLACEKDFYVGRWLVEPSNGRVCDGSSEARFEPKVMQVLVFLSKKAGRTVSRDELIENVWYGTVVSEDAINRCISRLRRTFQPDPAVRIETLPKIGYRLLADIREVPAQERLEAPEDPSPPASASPEPELRRAFRSRRVWLFSGTILPALALVVLVSALVSRETGNGAIDFRVTPFTSLSGHEGMASFSSDGTHVAFAWRQPGSNDSDIYIKTVGSDHTFRLTSDPALELSPVWSPDGGRIAFVRLKEGIAQLIIVSSLGGSERRIATYPASEGSDLSWNPSGESIAFGAQTEPGKQYRIQLVAVESGSVSTLTNPPLSWIGDEYPSFSPDGSKLAFVRNRALGVSDIYLLDLLTRQTRRLTSDNLKIHGLAWESEGHGVVFSSNRGGGFSLWRLGLNEEKPTPLPFGGRHVDWVAVSRTSNRLLYQEWMASCGLLRLDLSSALSTPGLDLAGSMRFDWDPELSPDGQKMAFLSDRSGSAEVWVSDKNGDHRLQITSFGGAYAKTVKWSPDGQRLALTAPPAGHFDVFVADPNGAGITRLTFEESDDYSPAWSPDGQSLYFASNRSGKWEIWVMSREGKHPRQITRKGAKAGLPSPDGKWLYYVKPDQRGIWRQPVSTEAEEELVIPDFQPVDWNNWEVTASGIFFVTRPTTLGVFLHFYDPDSHERRQIMSLPRLHYDSGIDISPDGRFLLISSVAKSESDLVLVQYEQ